MATARSESTGLHGEARLVAVRQCHSRGGIWYFASGRRGSSQTGGGVVSCQGTMPIAILGAILPVASGGDAGVGQSRTRPMLKFPRRGLSS